MARKPKSACLDERPTTPVENICQEHGDFELIRQIGLKSRPPTKMSLTKFIVSQLGPPDFQWVGEFRYLIWERPRYRLFVNNTKGFCIEVPQEYNREQALVALAQISKDLTSV